MNKNSNLAHLNKEKPTIMHIDLNSCFATIEQQANRLLRGRPVAVSAYDTPKGMVLASSYEAKSLGVKLGVNNAEARQMAPGIVILTPDPSKYREAHRRFREVLLEFTPEVAPKSIDEFVLDFSGSPSLRKHDGNTPTSYVLRPMPSYDAHCARMEEIGREIKQRIREHLGEWVTVNIGIGTNRFLAKYAAGFGKPDGMTLIDHRNLEELLTTDPYKHKPMELIDLPGINTRYAARLMACGIKNPLEFLRADQLLLKKTVFKSVVGYYWWARLRGHEVDNRTFSTKSIGHQYALPKKTDDKKELARLYMKLCEKVGRRLRKNNFCARGIHLYMGFERGAIKPVDSPIGFENMHLLRSWHEGHRLGYRLYTTSEIFEAMKVLLSRAEIPSRVTIIAITVYDLEPWDPEQLSIFDYHESRVDSCESRNNHKKSVAITEYRSQEAKKRLSDALDSINSRYGEFVITPGNMIDMHGEILDRIAFGSTTLD